MARGIAKLNEECREYLKRCDAVTSTHEGAEMIEFTYDLSKLPVEPPEGVHFRLDFPPF